MGTVLLIFCARATRGRKALVGRAQWKNSVPIPEDTAPRKIRYSMRAVKPSPAIPYQEKGVLSPFRYGLLSYSILLTLDQQFCSR